MKKLTKIILPALIIAPLSGCGTHSNNNIVSTKVGDVTYKDVLDDMGVQASSKAAFNITLNKILKDKYKNKVDEKEATKKYDAQVKSVGGEKNMEKALKQQDPSLTLKKYKKELIEDLYRKELLNDNVKVTDNDIEKMTREASHILISNGKTDDTKAKQKADTIYDELKKDAKKFDDYAKKESDDTASRIKNGKLGLVVKGDTIPEFEKELFKLKSGEISKVVKTQFGYHIIKRLDTKPTESEIKMAKQKIQQYKIKEDKTLLPSIYKKLFKSYNVQFDDKEISTYINNNLMSSNSNRGEH